MFRSLLQVLGSTKASIDPRITRGNSPLLQLPLIKDEILVTELFDLG